MIESFDAPATYGQSVSGRVPFDPSSAVVVRFVVQVVGSGGWWRRLNPPRQDQAGGVRLESGEEVGDDGVMKLKLDLHDIYNRGDQIDRALEDVMDEAEAKKVKLVELIPGKGTGQLKKRVLRFLQRKDVKARYHRVEKDSDNSGRIFVHFRWK